MAVSAYPPAQRHYSERVLRYPDGVERRIIYPSTDVPSEDESISSLSDPYRSFAEEFQPDRWGPEVSLNALRCWFLFNIYAIVRPQFL